MLTPPAPSPAPSRTPGETQLESRRLRIAVDRIGNELGKLDGDVRRVRKLLGDQEDPVSLDRLIESRKRAGRHAHRAKELFTDGADGPAFSHILHLLEEVRAGIASARTTDDIAAMLDEARGDPLIKGLSTLEARIRTVDTQAGQLFELTTTAQQDLAKGVPAMTITSGPSGPSGNDGTERAIRDLGDLLASRLGAAPASATNRRFPAVADQITASLDAYGLPHEGVQLPPDQDEATVRARLIDGLNRNFASREQDGYRTYYRSAPQPVARDADSDAQLLRGASLVNANMLRSEADGVLAILDRLPEMLRFTPAWSRELPEARGRVVEAIGQIVETARDPMGINVKRGEFQFDRLGAAVTDVLELGEILPPALASRLRDPDDADLTFGMLADDEATWVDDLRATTSLIRNDEVFAELKSLYELMDAIMKRVTKTPLGSGRGLAAAQLEELLSVAYDSAAALEDDLARLGTSAAEQTVLFFSDTAKTDERLSLAQYIGWTRAVCAPFSRVENRAANLSTTELAVLHRELRSLTGFSSRLSGASPGLYNVGLPGIRRQLKELDTFLEQASAQAGALVAGTSGAVPAK